MHVSAGSKQAQLDEADLRKFPGGSVSQTGPARMSKRSTSKNGAKVLKLKNVYLCVCVCVLHLQLGEREVVKRTLL